jgi:hypothetical protein
MLIRRRVTAAMTAADSEDAKPSLEGGDAERGERDLLEHVVDRLDAPDRPTPKERQERAGHRRHRHRHPVQCGEAPSTAAIAGVYPGQDEHDRRDRSGRRPPADGAEDGLTIEGVVTAREPRQRERDAEVGADAGDRGIREHRRQLSPVPLQPPGGVHGPPQRREAARGAADREDETQASEIVVRLRGNVRAALVAVCPMMPPLAEVPEFEVHAAIWRRQ